MKSFYFSFMNQLFQILFKQYDFHKTIQDPTNGEFQHQYFVKNRPDLLVHIKRKAHNKSIVDIPTLPLPIKKNTVKIEQNFSKTALVSGLQSLIAHAWLFSLIVYDLDCISQQLISSRRGEWDGCRIDGVGISACHAKWTR